MLNSFNCGNVLLAKSAAKSNFILEKFNDYSPLREVRHIVMMSEVDVILKRLRDSLIFCVGKSSESVCSVTSYVEYKWVKAIHD